MPAPTQPKAITGHHVAAMIVAFFAVVIAANVIMARAAIHGFGGTTVDNSYVASQHFNRWLNRAATDRARGWQAVATRPQPGTLTVALADRSGQPIPGAQVTAHAEHPLGALPARDLALTESAPGRYAAALPPGRWRLAVKVSAQGAVWHTVADLP